MQNRLAEKRGAELENVEQSNPKHPVNKAQIEIIENQNARTGPCLVPKKFYKIFQIPRHIESLDTCMKY